ncbi:MAG: hypothetical protein RR052_02615 [Oscillospiraceae bacterium]
MSFLVTASTKEILLDTLPAVKITHYNGVLRRDNVYAYAKLYVLNGGVQISFTVFDENPPQTQRMAAAFNFAMDKCDDFLFCSSDCKGEVAFTLYRKNGDSTPLMTTKAQVNGGEDEQGFYWNVEFNISKKLIVDNFGNTPFKNNLFCGNIYLYDTQETAFGSAFKVSLADKLPFQANCGQFVCVPY